jgi:hypothetical protein
MAPLFVSSVQSRGCEADGHPPCVGTVQAMTSIDKHEITETEQYITDLRSFGGASHRLANLSRYADMASSSVLNGDADSSNLATFVGTLRSYYTRIKSDVLASAREDRRATIDLGMGELPEDADIHIAALVLDQAIAWLNGEVMPSNFERQLRMSTLKMQMEESSIGEQLKRSQAPTSSGLYA